MSMTTLFCLLCVSPTHSATDAELELALRHIDLLKSHVQLLISRKISADFVNCVVTNYTTFNCQNSLSLTMHIAITASSLG